MAQLRQELGRRRTCHRGLMLAGLGLQMTLVVLVLHLEHAH